MSDARFLPFGEPAVSTLLIYASFILLLNIVNNALNRLLHCGLIGQILVGIAWGVPGANWLSLEAQETIVQLGYLGLILLVYEGGLSTSTSSVKQNVLLSAGVAATGILLPLALSFILMPVSGASPVQSFAAGAALSSTSLGTTFTVLSTCNLTHTRLGTVLTTAAMLDDVVGLIMVQVVSELGTSGGNVQAGTILRPVGVSLAIVLALVLLCRYVVKPMARRFLPKLQSVLKRTSHASFIVQSLFLIGIFAGATYAGTSGLFAAYLAGVTLTWWDKSCVPNAVGTNSDARKSGPEVFESGYAAVTNLLLKPFFFASIGFAIPITQIFNGPIVWRGVIYAILMLIGKLATGLWLVRFPKKPSAIPHSRAIGSSRTTSNREKPSEHRVGTATQAPKKTRRVSLPANVAVRRDPIRVAAASDRHAPHETQPYSRRSVQRDTRTDNDGDRAPDSAAKPVSLYPSCVLGLAMAARGEIGYLIASVAESSGVFSSGGGAEGTASPLFLIVIWAVTLCTLIGPVSVGLLVRRVRRLEKEKGEQEGRQEALGLWGVGIPE